MTHENDDDENNDVNSDEDWSESPCDGDYDGEAMIQIERHDNGDGDGAHVDFRFSPYSCVVSLRHLAMHAGVSFRFRCPLRRPGLGPPRKNWCRQRQRRLPRRFLCPFHALARGRLRGIGVNNVRSLPFLSMSWHLQLELARLDRSEQ